MSDHLTLGQRWSIVALSKEAKWSQKRIADKLKQSTASVSRTLKRYKQTGDVIDKPKSGRPSILDTTDLINNPISEAIDRNRQITSPAIVDIIQRERDITVSERTIRRLRHQLTYRQVLYRICPILSTKAIAKRLEYSNTHRSNTWSNVIFSDEKIFTLSKEGVRVWKRSDEPSIQIQQPMHCIQLMVWGGVWMDGRTTIHITDDIIDADEYQNILFEHLIEPSFDRDKIFQQDNARPHIARSTIDFLRAMNVSVLDKYPPYSPELNPIEKVWSWMVPSVRKFAAINKEAFVNAIQSSWNDIPQEIIQRYIGHLTTVCGKIVEANGGSIRE